MDYITVFNKRLLSYKFPSQPQGYAVADQTPAARPISYVQHLLLNIHLRSVKIEAEGECRACQ